MDTNRLVSIIIPVYNRQEFLAEAIESAFAQTYRPIEVIVVDDGSADGSAEIARSFPDVQYIYQPNQGVAVARNTGIAAAQGEFIAFLDADDRWMHDKLCIQVRYLLEHPNADCTFGKGDNYYDLKRDARHPRQKSSLEDEQMAIMSMVVRKAKFEQVGWFDPSYRIGSDFEWILRAKDAGLSIVILPDVLLHRRIHDSNLSGAMEERKGSVLRMFKASIDRKRARDTGP